MHFGLAMKCRGLGGSDVGIPGEIGFGVGVATEVPSGLSDMTGTTVVGHANYGNYLVANAQSVMVWIPRFWYKITNVTDAPFYGTKVEIADRPKSGYVLHRAFIDGGVEKPGVFVDKYKWSNALADGTDNTDTTGGIAASIAARRPVSTHTDNNRLSYLTGNSQTPTDTYGGVYAAAKSRGDDFAPFSIFVRSALGLLALAHQQALMDGTGSPITGATTYAAWMGVAPYAPKGCNNNALGDAQDAGVSYTGSGYSNQPLTGSGDPFARTTHNGQACGVADLNGGMHDVVAGLTNIGAAADDYLILKESIAIKDLIDATSGDLGAFSATPYDAMAEVWWPHASAYVFYGNGTNQVLSGETDRSALGYHLTACGLGMAAAAMDSSQAATNSFGGDGFYQYHRSLLAPIAGGSWSSASYAGLWFLLVGSGRASSSLFVGSRAVLYV